MFGNPYKKDKNMVMVDEADLNEVAPMKGGRGGSSEAAALKNRMADPNARLSRKRKAGPIRKDYTFKRKCLGLLGSSTSSASSGSSASSVTSETASLSDFAASDVDSDSASVISSSSVAGDSELDDDPDDRLVVDFEFPSDRDEDAGAVLTPHVRQFIEGPDEGGTPPEVPIAVEPTPLPFHHHHHQHLPPPPPSSSSSIPQQLQQQPQPPQLHHHVPTVVPIVAAAAPLPVNPILGPSGSASSTASSSLATNDMTSEISNILKTCHNGANSYASSTQEEPPPIAPPEPDPPSKPSKKQLKKEAERLLNGENHFLTPAAPPPPQAPPTGSKKTTTPKPQPTPAAPVELSEEDRDRIREENYTVRSIVFKDIRRPGRNYSTLLEHLHLIKGDLATRSAFIEMCVREALRFRRRKMADSIQEWWDGQLEAEQKAVAAAATSRHPFTFNHQAAAVAPSTSRSRTSHYAAAPGSSKQFPHQPHPPNKQQQPAPGTSKANHQSRI